MNSDQTANESSRTAQIHGYDYKYYQAQHIPGYYDTWIRPHILASLLPAYDFVITLDADVTVTHPEVPFEWLFNHWNVTERTSISLPWDIEEQRPETGEVLSTDSKGVQVLNAGFVIVQNLPFTYEMLKAWGDCPTEKTYKGCAQWKTVWSHEQRAFSEYIRYDYNPQGDNIVVRFPLVSILLALYHYAYVLSAAYPLRRRYVLARRHGTVSWTYHLGLQGQLLQTPYAQQVEAKRRVSELGYADDGEDAAAGSQGRNR
jgi:hypothetical protein